MAMIVLTCCVFLLAVASAGPLHAAEELQSSIHILNRELSSVATSARVLAIPASRVVRSKRSEEDEDKINVPAPRHTRHRRRRRCRTRSSCPRGFGANKQMFVRKSNGSIGWPSDVPPKSTTPLEEDTMEESTKINGNDSKEIEAYDEPINADEIDFDQISLPSWTEAMVTERNENADYDDSASPIEDHTTFQEGLTSLLTKLFQNLRNESLERSKNAMKELDLFDTNIDDPCQKWVNSREKFEEAFSAALAALPGCPCHYPSDIFYEDKIWDERQRKYFRWRDASADSQRLDVYKPGAAYCVRSLLAQGSESAAAQHCCYDRKRKLLTRGSGAGTPNFVSPEISPILHERIDVLPWRLCKGDFSRYNCVRPPNNDNSCEVNPDDDEYQRQIDDTKYF